LLAIVLVPALLLAMCPVSTNAHPYQRRISFFVPLPYGDCPRRADGLHSGGFAPLDPRQRPKRGSALLAPPESRPLLVAELR